MRLTRIVLTLSLSLLLTLACSKRITNLPPEDNHGNTNVHKLVNRVGDSTRFEIGTWNIEWFPKEGNTTVSDVKTIIQNLDIDMFAVEEISNVSAFNRLLDSLPGWDGKLSGDTYSNGTYQKTGILYKTAFISLSNVHNIFTDDYYAFPRPPLTAYVEIRDTRGEPFNFNLIVLHLKAKSGDENEARRRSACEKLKQYIDLEISNGADADFVVLGDWNDQLNDPPDRNVFTAFLDDSSEYTFLTKGLSGQYSYISNSYKSLIDNILITNDALSEYGSGKTEVLYLDSEYSPYLYEVSDHRPVVSIFKGFRLYLN